MSITKRFFDLARANLNALLDKAGGDTTVDELTDDELEAELQRRRERRRREEDERAAAARAAEHARARAAANAAGRAGAAGATGTGAAGASAKRAPSGDAGPRYKPPVSPGNVIPDKRLRELYAQLEVPYGAPFEEIKKSFRRLMRKYHPDLHIGNPQKHKTATQLTMSLTQAYNELEQHLTGGRRV